MLQKRGIKLALELGLKSIVFEVDASLVIESLESSAPDYSYNGSIIHEISGMELRFERFKIQYVPRECNRIVGFLAHFAKYHMFKVWLGEIPN